MTTWSQIGVHLKPVILLNVNNFYSSLRDFINKYALSFAPHVHVFLAPLESDQLKGSTTPRLGFGCRQRTPLGFEPI